MNCPSCNSKTRVSNSRGLQVVGDQDNTRRRRECLKCGARFSTIEVIVELARGFESTEINTAQVEQIAKAITNGNGHKPAPKPQKALTPEQRDLRKRLAMALHRARCAAVVIEDEDLE